MDNWISKDGYATSLQADLCLPKFARTQTHLIRFTTGKFCHYHKKTTEFFYITGGRGRVTIDNREIPLSAGSSLVIHPYQIHTFHNDSGQEGLEAIMVKVNPHEDDTYRHPEREPQTS